jgi:hypothetical protein
VSAIALMTLMALKDAVTRATVTMNRIGTARPICVPHTAPRIPFKIGAATSKTQSDIARSLRLFVASKNLIGTGTSVASRRITKAMSNYPHFRPGQKVRTKFGDVRTVRKQIGSQVFVEELDINGWYNAGQLWLVLDQPIISAHTHLEQ